MATVPVIHLVSNSAWNLWHYRRPLWASLLEQDVRVVAVAPPGPEAVQLRAAGLTFLPLAHLQAHGRQPWNDWRAYRELKQLWAANRPDLVLGFTIKPNILGCRAAAELNIPFVPTLTGLGYSFMHTNWTNILAQRLYARSLRRVPYALFHNADDRQLFVQKGWIDAARARLVPGSGIDLDYYRPTPVPPTAGGFRFLYLGRFLADKGLYELAEALRMLRRQYGKVACIMAPEQSTNPSAVPAEVLARWQAEQLFTIVPTQQDVRPLLADAHALVLPSFREGMPRSVLEAMACGRPVVATDVPGCRQAVVPGATGWLTPPRDAVGLATALEAALLSSEEELQQMGQNGRLRVAQHFSEEAVVAVYRHIVELVLGNPLHVVHPVS